MAKTSPGAMRPAFSRMTVSTARSMEPRCTGMCGALATSEPSAANTAQEKSSRSLMFSEFRAAADRLRRDRLDDEFLRLVNEPEPCLVPRLERRLHRGEVGGRLVF